MLLPMAGTAWAALPPGWIDADIGSPGSAGAATYTNGLWTVTGGGADIWNAADQFNFASTNYPGDGTMIVRVINLQNSDPGSGWSKAGLMFRNDSTAGSVNVSIVATATQGVSFQWRSTAGGSSSFSQHSGITAPVSLKLVRASGNFTGYYSTDGSNWVLVSSQMVAMNNTVMAGLDVTAHNNSALNTATFTNFSLGFVATPPVNVAINATNVINTVPTNAFGIFMAVWDTWGSSTPAQLKQAGVTAMRYPGGGYADNYRWSSYLMTPFDGQAGNLGYLSGATDMGHFIQLMSNAQAQAVISVDWGSGFLWNSNKTAMAIPSTNGSPQEAAAWVAYANASTDIYGTTNDVTIGVDAEGNNWQTAGYWAMIRAANPLTPNDGYNFLRINHPAPVHIQYWEVGNEPYGNAYYSTGTDGYECDYAAPYPYTTYPRYGNALLSPAAYGQAVKAFAIAMKAVDPTIKVGAYSSTPPGDYSWDYINGVNNSQHWTPQVLAQCGSNIDFVIVHWYPNFSDNVGTSLLSEAGSIIPVMINGTGAYPHMGTNSGLEDWIINYCPNPANVQILVTEFGADNYPYLVNGTNGMPILGPVEALFAADCYSTWLNYPAFANADWLDFDANSFLGSGNGPVVYAMQMLRHLCNPGDAFVKATSDTSNLRVQGVVRQDGNLGILLINESMDSSQTVNVTVTNANLNTTGTIYRFGTNNWTSFNEVPATGPGSNSISGVGSTFSVTLPAYTMDVLVIPVLGNTPPVLAAISNYTVNAGQTVAFTASATDTNQPPPTLTFSLLSAPTNATLDPNSGAFSFRPLVSQANSINPISLKVTDSGTPPLSATQSFTVTVNPLTQPQFSSAGWSNEQFVLQVSGQAGPDYAVLGSTNLIDWSVLFETNSPPMPFVWGETNAATLPVQFYRIQAGPPLP
ncbi:MAG TPA: hypothetical protein VJT54_18365 [Verrucomicrobiae bacterium]|nr:hypothetical protein [Verrucomicrobiae bacterium]